ncbi:hypothetical protein P9G84_02565 [Brevibacillus centrosporus]|uniref:hypothetical protein n=1 Tax=Brevibacillus centrosporus TaxID=54910 RepID=UPI001143287F|nr:hypothetical protein [Brevibacillus centrosporus]MEC2127877.1 hypothetical protein [Brevibacillus centrosporus]GED32122.1 hypothetical protein BCE02nite_32630 [Brevibacillus centrosporus]
MKNWIKSKIPFRESLFELYATVYSLVMVSLLLFGIFGDSSFLEKMSLVVVFIFMCAKLPVYSTVKEKKKPKAKKAFSPDIKEYYSDEIKKKPRSRRKKKAKDVKVQTQKQNNKPRINKEDVSGKDPQIKSPELRVPIAELQRASAKKEKIQERYPRSSSVEVQSPVTTTEPQSPVDVGISIPTELMVIDDIDHAPEQEDVREEAQVPENIDQIVAALRTRVFEEDDRVVNITHLRAPKENLPPLPKGPGFESITKNASVINAVVCNVQNGVARMVDSDGEFRWIRLPEDIKHNDLRNNHPVQLELRKVSGKFEVLSASIS